MDNKFRDKRIVVIGQVWPESRSSAAGKRMLQLLACFNDWGMQIYFGSTANKSEFSDDLAPFNCIEFDIWLNDQRSDAVLKELDPDIVLFDRFMMEEQFGWRVAEQCPNAMTILDTEDLHFLRYARLEMHKAGSTNIEDFMYSERCKRELASIMRCDLSLLISDFEFALLRDTFHISPSILMVLPFMEHVVQQEDIANWKSFDDRAGFVFIGNFIHEPNWQTVRQIKTQIWPLLRKRLPKVKMHIYGAYPSAKVLQLHNDKECFLVHGRAEDALEVISQAKVLLAPIPFGAGIKGKFVDAMRVGTPSITTTVGAEAMQNEMEWCGFVENDIEEIVNKAVELYHTEEVWKAKQQAGIKLLAANYNAAQLTTSFYTCVHTIFCDLYKHRKSNFLGQVFKHHSALSSKYMGLWIEEKNKKSELD